MPGCCLEAASGLGLSPPPSFRQRSSILDFLRTKGTLALHAYTAIVEHCPGISLYVGCVPGLAGTHCQGATLDELNANLTEVVSLILESGEPALEGEFIGTRTVRV